jgi:UDPglucose 6-dehydrogenase
MRVCVYGETVSALVLAAGLAESGNQVRLVGGLEAQNQEKGLASWIEQQKASGRLEVYKGESTQGVVSADVHFIALHSMACDAARDLAVRIGQVEAGADSSMVITASFSLGKARELGELAAIAWAINPDFGAEGRAMNDFLRPGRIIIGCDFPPLVQRLRVLFAPRNRQQDIIQVMSPESAELTKYATNVMLATRISLMNELAQAAEYLGADIEQVRQGMGSDERIGFSYLYPGVGFGGDYLIQELERTKALFDQAGATSELINSVIAINEEQKDLLFRKLWRHFAGQLRGKCVTLWGVSYKPETASIQNAPSLRLLQSCLAQGMHVCVYDPMAMDALKAYAKLHFKTKWQSRIRYAATALEALEGSDALLLVTEWKAFWNPDFDAMKKAMRQPLIFDGRNLYDSVYLKSKGFSYSAIGRATR